MTAARAIIERLGSSSFRQPENFDPVAESRLWVMYAGGNDWEAGITWVAVIFPSDESNRRVWFEVKHARKPNSDQSEEGQEQVKKHGEKAWRRWKQTALAAHRNKNHGARSWLDAFKSALESREMEPYVKAHGVDKTQWAAEESLGMVTAKALIERTLGEQHHEADEVDPTSYLRGVLPVTELEPHVDDDNTFWVRRHDGEILGYIEHHGSVWSAFPHRSNAPGEGMHRRFGSREAAQNWVALIGQPV
jgi:hypothetical protein